MELSITVTNGCNLKCKYCYQGKHENGEQISSESISQLSDFIKSKMLEYNDSVLHIVFIGGEPLLAYKKIIQIVETIEQKLTDKKIKYYITTNGTVLNDEIIKLLSQKRIEVSVSIDGNRKLHDQNRIDVHGHGTFEKVISTIQTLRKNNVDIIARMTVTPEGAHVLCDDVIGLFEQGITKINPVCDFTCEWSSMQIDALKKSYKKLAEWYIQINSKVHLACFDGRFYSLLTRKQFFCNAGTGPHYVVATSGEIYPCNYVTDNPQFLIGDLKEIKSSSEVRKMYLECIADKDEKCIECEAKDFCHGKKCSFINWKTSGYLNVTSDILCEHEKFMYFLLQEILISLCKTNPKEINDLMQYIETNKLGNKTYDYLKGMLWNMI